MLVPSKPRFLSAIMCCDTLNVETPPRVYFEMRKLDRPDEMKRQMFTSTFMLDRQK